MSILIFFEKSKIWAQSRLCASNHLKMPSVWSWSCTFKNDDFFFSFTLLSLKYSQILPKNDRNMQIAPLVSSWALVLWTHGFFVRFVKKSSSILQRKWSKSTTFTTTTSCSCNKQIKLAVPNLDWRLFLSLVLVSINTKITKNNKGHVTWAYEGENIPST